MKPADRIVSLLQKNLTDYAGRNAQWIFPFRPDIKELLSDSNNFPLVTVEAKNPSTDGYISVDGVDHEETIHFFINVWVQASIILDVENTDEDITYTTGTDKYELSQIPTSKISSVAGIVSGSPVTFSTGDYELIDDDNDGFYDSIEFVGATKPDNSTTFTVSYQKVENRGELAETIANDINNYLRINWKDELIPYLWDYFKVNSTHIDFDQGIGVIRHELQVKFNGVNIGA